MRDSLSFRAFRPGWNALAILICLQGFAVAHLGEVHPDGQHDFFPDFEISPVSDQIYFRDVLNVVGARDLQQIPDGSGRFLAMRGNNSVRIIQHGQLREQNYLTAGGDVPAQSEGSTSLAIHPGFATEGDPGYGKFYTLTIDGTPEERADFDTTWDSIEFQYVLTEWSQEDVSAQAFSGASREIARFDQGNRFHNVNHLIFGPDGFMYISLGEDNKQLQATSRSSVYGKILRIDPLGENSANGQYGIPDDNPYAVGGIQPGSGAGEVYAYGLRNPWRIAFDRETGELYSFDVGLNSIEEISLIRPAGNYGWPFFEGSFLARNEVVPDLPNAAGLTRAEQWGMINPVLQVDQTDTNSIIGGVIYRGDRFPDLHGKVVFGSWNTHDVFVGDPDTGEVQILVPGEGLAEYMEGTSYVSLNEDVDGEIYISGGLRVVSLFAEPDFDDSGAFDLPDVETLCQSFGSSSSVFDLNGDLQSDGDDLDVLLEFANVLPGDFDLDGLVSFPDFLTLSGNFGNTEAAYSSGDANCDGSVGFGDFLTMSANFGLTRTSTENVPEGSSITLLLFGLLLIRRTRGR